MFCTPPTGLAFLTTMTCGFPAAVVVDLLLLPPPDWAMTNATTATTTTNPSTAQRVPVVIEDLLLSVPIPRRRCPPRSDQTEVRGGPRAARNRARGSSAARKSAAGAARAEA